MSAPDKARPPEYLTDHHAAQSEIGVLAFWHTAVICLADDADGMTAGLLREEIRRIDGLGCCDQFTAHRLAGAGLIRPVVREAVGERVRAELTTAGITALGGDHD